MFTVDASFCALAPNPGDAADIICSSINIFLVVCILSDVLKELDCRQELIIEMRYLTNHLTCLLIYHGTTTHL